MVFLMFRRIQDQCSYWQLILFLARYYRSECAPLRDNPFSRGAWVCVRGVSPPDGTARRGRAADEADQTPTETVLLVRVRNQSLS